MDIVRFGRWEVLCDSEATRTAYAGVFLGSPEECGCEPCQNFAASRGQIYTPNILALLRKLGISSNREAEIYHLARLASGRHLYGGWFHFVGSIQSGSDATKQIAENAWQPDLEEADRYFSVGFSSHLALVQKSFSGFPLVQLEFSAEVPWVISALEPN
jgi:hypothetical protein